MAVPLLAVGTLAGGASAAATRVHPHQSFLGLVNGKAADALIAVACPVNATTGVPVDDHVEAKSPGATALGGYTGSRATSIVVDLVTTSAAKTTTLGDITRYGVSELVPAVQLPCSGTGIVSFDPSPTSRSAKAFNVTVTFGNVTVPPGVRR